MTVAPGSSRALPIRLRQSRPELGGLMGILGYAVLAYTIAGFVVFWFLTGSTTIGVGGTWTALGGIVWVGPIFVWLAVWLAGPRGGLRRLWARPVRITIDRDGIAWTLSNRGAGTCSWSGLGGVSSGVDHRVRWRVVFGVDGTELFGFAAPLVDEATGERAELPDLVSRVRPDLFEPLDARHPGRACVRRSAPVIAEAPEGLTLDPVP